MDAKLEALDLQADKIRKELAETGRVVRRKASALGENITDAAGDARTTAAARSKAWRGNHDLSRRIVLSHRYPRHWRRKRFSLQHLE